MYFFKFTHDRKDALAVLMPIINDFVFEILICVLSKLLLVKIKKLPSPNGAGEFLLWNFIPLI